MSNADRANPLRAFVTDVLERQVRRSDLEHAWELDCEDARTAELIEELRNAARRLIDRVEEKSCGQDATDRPVLLGNSSPATTTASLSDDSTKVAASDTGAHDNTSRTSAGAEVAIRSSEEARRRSKSSNQTIVGSNPAPEVAIPYRVEDGIVVLLPQNKAQFRDLPFLMAQAEKLGVSQTGAFKYVLPDDYIIDIPNYHGYREKVLSFKCTPSRTGDFLAVESTETSEYIEVDDHRSGPMNAETLAAEFERVLGSPDEVSTIRYATDQPAHTEEERKALGLPLESPVCPLKDNQLDLTRYKVPGLHTPYEYSGQRALFTTHDEDGDIPSINFLYFGEKLWNVVPEHHRHLVEADIRKWKCGQKVRHAGRYNLRSRFKSMGASCTSFVQRAKEAVFVYGRAYHQGGAIKPTRAEAVNYAPPGWSIEGYQECRSSCPGPLIPNSFLEFRAPGEEQLVEVEVEVEVEGEGHVQTELGRSRNQKGSRSKGKPSSPKKAKRMEDTLRTQKLRSKAREELGQIEDQIRRVDKRCKIPRLDSNHLPSGEVLKLVSAIWSRPAIAQFCSLVRSRRDPGAMRVELDLEGDVLTRIERRVRNINISSRRSMLEKLLVRLNQSYLAEDVDNSKDGRLRADTAVLDRIRNKFGWKRSTFDYHRQKGSQWRRVCGPYEGLMCLIFLELPTSFGISPQNYLEMKPADLATFHRLLDHPYTKSICAAGKAFQESLIGTANDVEFMWEGREPSLDTVSEENLLRWLKPFPSTSEDIYEPDKYPHWPRPAGWPEMWQWPVDPMSLPTGTDETPCDLCSETACPCIDIINQVKPRIKDYGEKGRGLQARARVAGQLAYQKGDLIGQITGELVPLGWQHDGWTLEVVRADISEEPAVCQIHSATVGNPFRLMNHDCEPSARFRGMRVSGRYRAMVEARGDIRDGEEITAYYGRDYFTKGCPCEKHRGSKHARATS